MPTATGLGDIPRAILVSFSGFQPLSRLITGTFCSCLGATQVHPVPAVSPPGILHSLQALWVASAISSCPHGHPQMPIYTHSPWHLPAESCQLHPHHRDAQAQIMWVLVTSGPQEPITWLFIYIPKAAVITPRGGITSGSCILGQNVDGKKNPMNSQTTLKRPRRLERQPQACPCQ